MTKLHNKDIYVGYFWKAYQSYLKWYHTWGVISKNSEKMTS